MICYNFVENFINVHQYYIIAILAPVADFVKSYETFSVY